MKFIDFIKQFFEKKQPELTIVRLLIPDNELKKIFNCWSLIMDKQYKLYSFDEVYDFIKYDNLSFKKYKSEYHDCDDFALILLGRLKEKFEGGAFGLGLSTTHAFNVFVDDKKILWIIEPQTDTFFRPINTIKYKLSKVIF